MGARGDIEVGEQGLLFTLSVEFEKIRHRKQAPMVECTN